MSTEKAVEVIANSPTSRFASAIMAKSVMEKFEMVLKDRTDSFVASMIELYGNDSKLQRCEPKEVIMEALKAASLRLPVNRNLGYSWILPYDRKQKDGTKKSIPTFQVG